MVFMLVLPPFPGNSLREGQIMNAHFRGIFLALSGLFLATTAWAQSTNANVGSIAGLVSDLSGAPLPSLKVWAIAQSTGLERSTSTNTSGAYEFSALPPDIYRIKVEAFGMETIINQVDVLVGGTTRVNIK